MNLAFLISLIAAGLTTSVSAQDRIYRCGNEYTNTVPSPQTRGCKLINGGNVTVVQGTRAAASAPARPAAGIATSPAGSPRVNTGEQKSRDSDARQILESELKRSEARQVELLKDYNDGSPVRRPDEAAGSQKYLDRVAEIKASLARNESDIAGIRRELGRVQGSTAAK